MPDSVHGMGLECTWHVYLYLLIASVNCEIVCVYKVHRNEQWT